MSGPKIVELRIVRAAEDRAWATVRARLDTALRRWHESASRHAIANLAGASQSLTAAVARLDADHQSIGPPRSIRAVLDQAGAQLRFVQEETRLLEEKTIVNIQNERQAARRQHRAIEETADRLTRAGWHEESARLLATPTETVLDAALDLLANDERSRQADRLQEATLRLAGEATPRSFRQWLATVDAGNEGTQPGSSRLDRLSAEWTAVTGSALPDSWQLRLDLLRNLQNHRELRLHTDSLVLELDAAVASLRRDRDRRHLIEDIKAELAAFDTVPSHLVTQMAAAQADASADLDALANDIKAWTEAEARRRDAHRIREIMISTLRDMGYDVREGMAAAWTEQGRLILSQPGSAEYGVELRNVGQGDRIRTQLIRFGQPENDTTATQRQRDVEMESKWCATHAAVLETLHARGLAADLLASRPVGAVPLAIHPPPETDDRARHPSAQVTAPKRQSLP